MAAPVAVNKLDHAVAEELSVEEMKMVKVPPLLRNRQSLRSKRHRRSRQSLDCPR